MPLQTKEFTAFLDDHKDKIILREPCGKEIWFPLLNGYSAYKIVPKGKDVYCVCTSRTAVIHNNEYTLIDGDFRDELESIGFKKDFFEVFGRNVDDYKYDIMQKIPMYF